jgi:hypothetical protein
MNRIELQATQGNIERVKERIFNLITQCLMDIEKTASTSGFTMRDVGVDVEKYISTGDSYIVEMKVQR